jgi:hypothetical protein
VARDTGGDVTGGVTVLDRPHPESTLAEIRIIT